jgi:adenylate cyclase class IV
VAFIDDCRMFKLITLTILFSSLQPLMASSGDLGYPSKTEVELKINLTKTGHTKLRTAFLQKFKGEESSRSDFYFDIFKNDSYVLKTSQPSFKIRLQWDGIALTWQTQKTLNSSTLSIFGAKKTESISMDIPNDTALISSIQNYHAKLNALDPYALTIASSIQNSLDDKGVLAFNLALCPQCTKSERYFSTHMNDKKRVKIKLKIAEDQFTIQVGETNNRGIISYELEAEVKKSSDLAKSAESLHKWLTTNGLDSTHIESNIPVDPTQLSEEKLKQVLHTQY